MNSSMMAFSILPFISFIGAIALYGLSIVALVFLIKALRIYIKKNSDFF